MNKCKFQKDFFRKTTTSKLPSNLISTFFIFIASFTAHNSSITASVSLELVKLCDEALNGINERTETKSLMTDWLQSGLNTCIHRLLSFLLQKPLTSQRDCAINCIKVFHIKRCFSWKFNYGKGCTATEFPSVPLQLQRDLRLTFQTLSNHLQIWKFNKLLIIHW